MKIREKIVDKINKLKMMQIACDSLAKNIYHFFYWWKINFPDNSFNNAFLTFLNCFWKYVNHDIVRNLFNCNNVKIELINKLILRKKEIHADHNNLCKWIELRLCKSRFCRIASNHDNLYFCFAYIWALSAF